MKWLIGFFEWLWGRIKSLGVFLVALPATVMAAISTVLGSAAAIKSTISSGSSYIDTLDQYGTAAVSNVSSLFTGLHDFFTVAVYALSLDFAFSVAVQILTILITATVALLVFIFVAIPAFIVQYYTIRVSTIIATALLPHSWIPAGLQAWINHTPQLGQVVFGNAMSGVKHWHEGKWI